MWIYKKNTQIMSPYKLQLVKVRFKQKTTKRVVLTPYKSILSNEEQKKVPLSL